MKCKQEDCQKPAAKLQAYCSREHAPFGNFGRDAVTPSQRPGIYSTKADGVPSRVSIGDDRPKKIDWLPPSASKPGNWQHNAVIMQTGSEPKRDTGNGGTGLHQKREPITTAESVSSEQRTERTTTPINGNTMNETAQSSLEKLSPAGPREIRLTASMNGSQSSGEEISISTSLVDDSIQDLRGLMSSIAKNAKDDVVARNVHAVNAACNCAKNIAQLMRLKLDVIKEIRK